MSNRKKIRTFLRSRPASGAHPGYAFPSSSDVTVPGGQSDAGHVYQFSFDRVFPPDTTQTDVFQSAGKPAVLSALSGINSTVFTYGMTGSGKTYTMLGATDAYENRGLVPRALSFLFEQLARETSQEFQITITYLQIYNENAYDLFNDCGDYSNESERVQLGEADGEVTLKNCAHRQVTSEKDALGLLFWGNNNRVVAETACNLESSRSHCILTVNIEARIPGEDAVRRSKLHLVDLAGSESVKKTNAQGLLLQEACNINLSLHYLEQVIIALQKHQEHIPYRNSIMTSILRDSLGGNCDTSMIATINPTPVNLTESVSTCRFAQRVAMITNCARVNECTDPDVVIQRLKRELAKKDKELEFYRGQGSTKGPAATGPLSESEREYCKEKVDLFLSAESDTMTDVELPLSDPREIQGFFCLLREQIMRLQSSMPTDSDEAAIVKPPVQGSGDGEVTGTVLQQELEAKDAEIEYLQGMLGQKTKKRHPLRFQTHDRTQEKAEKAQHNERIQRGGGVSGIQHHDRDIVREKEVYKKNGRRHTVDDAASVAAAVYAPSNSSISPRVLPPRQARRGRGNQSPKRSRTGNSLPRSNSSQPGGPIFKSTQRAWMRAISPEEAQDVWKDHRLPAVSPSNKRAGKETKGVALLPYLGTHRKTPESTAMLLPVRRTSQPCREQADNGAVSGDGSEPNLPIEQAKEAATDEADVLYDPS